MNNEVLVRREARKDREQRRSSAPGDLPEPRLQDETRRTVDLGHSSNGPSWIDPAEIRVITTESRLGARLNCLLQQNRPFCEVATATDNARSPGKTGSGRRTLKPMRMTLHRHSRRLEPCAGLNSRMPNWVSNRPASGLLCSYHRPRLSP